MAIISDIHGNLPALNAVATDVERQRPDLVLHGGDLALIGSRPAEVIDLIREKEWGGVIGSADQMLFDASCRAEQERRAPKLRD